QRPADPRRHLRPGDDVCGWRSGHGDDRRTPLLTDSSPHGAVSGELASLAPPPGLRPYSPVPLPFHGGEVRLFAHPPGLWPGDLSGGRFGFLPHGAVSGVGEWPVRAEGARFGGPP